MYVVNQTIEISLELSMTSVPALKSVDGYDIVIKKPDNSVIYNSNQVDGVITVAVGDFVAPTDDTAGSIKFNYTPDQSGLMTISLVTGVAGNYTELYTASISVIESETAYAGSVLLPTT